MALSKPPAFEQAYAFLHNRLRNGDYLPGSRVQAGDVVSLLGISATPVREALSRLAGQGLLIDRRAIGYFVPPVDPVDLRDLYALASMLAVSAMRSINMPSLDMQRYGEPSKLPCSCAGELLVTIAALTANSALSLVAANVDDRLAPFAAVERALFGELDREQGEFVHWLANRDQRKCISNVARFYRRRTRSTMDIAALAGASMSARENIF